MPTNASTDPGDILALRVDERTTPVSPELRPPPRRVALFIGRSEQVRGRLFELVAGDVVGRDAALAVCLPFEGVSRRHAEIRATAEHAWSLRDLQSTNGTRVNGVAIDEHALANGDRVQFGTVELEYRLATEVEQRRAQQAATAHAQLAGLSERELEVARLVAQGLRSEDIGKALFIATRTVNTHLEHIYERLGIKSRAALAALVTQADA